ncbi:MAG TPA: CPXCG motif-containing cysteine-rich protein [Xanthomonadaceae bacterium]|nr:CPXCG motif-containing cysteine-rich protein [Xanthomonadaceae bacterium]
MLPASDIACPYCGEVITLLLDASAGPQRYIEDCQVCCRPITVDLDVDEDGAVSVRVQAEDEPG